MIIERELLHKQCGQVSCLTDDLIKLTRKLSTTGLRSSEIGVDTSLAYAFNTLAINRLQKSIEMFSLILEMLMSSIPLDASSSNPDNILVLATPSHSDPSVDMRPGS
jgi:hypothetical protein